MDVERRLRRSTSAGEKGRTWTSSRADESAREIKPMSSELEARSSGEVCRSCAVHEGRGMEESEVKPERMQRDDVRGRTFCLLIGSSLAPVPLLKRNGRRRPLSVLLSAVSLI